MWITNPDFWGTPYQPKKELKMLSELTVDQLARVDEAKKMIDEVGLELTKEGWFALAEDVSSYYDASAQAARDDIRRELGEDDRP